MNANVPHGSEWTAVRRIRQHTKSLPVSFACQRLFQLLVLVSVVQIISGCAATHGLIVRPGSNQTVDIHYSAQNNWNQEKICNTLRYHIVEVDQTGKYRPIRTNLYCDGGESNKPYSQPASLSEHIEIIRDQITGEYGEIVFIIHGGLVSRAKGLREALVLNRAIKADEGRNGQNRRYPIFINWRSGGVDAYGEQLFEIRKGEQRKILAKVTSPIQLVSDVGRGIADTPSLGALEGERLVSSFRGSINTCDSKRYKPAKVVCPEDRKGSSNSFLKTTGYLLMTPIRIVTAPFLNGPGRPAWENMVRRTRNAFWREPEDGHPAPRGVVMELFDDLFINSNENTVDVQIAPEKRPCGFDGHDVEITLIGHSMGTMIVSDLLDMYPQCPYEDIVFMAAAVSIREFQENVPPVLLRNEDTHFYNLSLLPKAEARETSAFGTVPSGSLLEWIDEMYTPPTTKFDRTLGKWANVREILLSVPAELRKQMTFRVFGLAHGEPSVHGAFNDVEMCFWQESFWGAEGSDWPEHQKDCQQFLEGQSIIEIR